MKKSFLRYLGIVGAALAVISIVLMLVTNSLVYQSGSITDEVSGIAAVFGKDVVLELGSTSTTVGHINNAWTALVSLIVAILGAVVLVGTSLVKPSKKKKGNKILRNVVLIAAGLLLIAGILIFFTLPAMNAANTQKLLGQEVVLFDGYSLGAGYIIAAILDIAGAGVAALSALLLKK